MSWVWPIPSVDKNIPGNETQGYFGAKRLYDIHTGVDIYCEPDSDVLAVESGVVLNIEPFTGANAGSPWWNETDAIWIKGASGIVVYGELDATVEVGQLVKAGEIIGNVKTVLKKDKGLPMTMLHLELYDLSMTETVWWNHGENKPKSLIDLTKFLEKSKIK